METNNTDGHFETMFLKVIADAIVDEIKCHLSDSSRVRFISLTGKGRRYVAGDDLADEHILKSGQRTVIIDEVLSSAAIISGKTYEESIEQFDKRRHYIAMLSKGLATSINRKLSVLDDEAIAVISNITVNVTSLSDKIASDDMILSKRLTVTAGYGIGAKSQHECIEGQGATSALFAFLN